MTVLGQGSFCEVIYSFFWQVDPHLGLPAASNPRQTPEECTAFQKSDQVLLSLGQKLLSLVIRDAFAERTLFHHQACISGA